MIAGRQINYLAAAALALAAVTIAAGIIIYVRYPRSQPLELSYPPAAEVRGEICIGGGVPNPGCYPVYAGDSLDDIILAAGGATDNADLARIRLYIPVAGETASPQKIDLNRAEERLLLSLPGIGEARARAIIDYREQNGGFRYIEELLKINDIGPQTYEDIKDLVTVAE